MELVNCSDLVAQQHQFSHPVHEPVEQADIDPNCAVNGALAAGLLLGIQGLNNILRFDGSLFDQDLADMSRVTRLLLLDSIMDIADLGGPAVDQDVAEIRYRLF